MSIDSKQVTDIYTYIYAYIYMCIHVYVYTYTYVINSNMSSILSGDSLPRSLVSEPGEPIYVHIYLYIDTQT